MSKEIILFDQLHSDLLCEIVKHVHSSKDYIRLRVVWKSWNLDLPKTPNHIKGPRLVLPFNDDTFDIEDKDFYLRLPEMRNTLLRGSSFGWLISVGIDGVLRMLNPFTKAYHDLPPMSTIPDIVDYQPDMKDEEYMVRHVAINHYPNDRVYAAPKSHIQKIYVQKIIISSSPDNDKQDFMAITIYGEYDRLAFCRFTDNKWTDFSTPEIICCNLQDAIFYEGKIYAIDVKTRLYEFDVKTSIGGISEVAMLPHHLTNNLNTKYLIRNVEGNLLMVIRRYKYHTVVVSEEDKECCYNTLKFEIYKLDKSEKQWTRMFNLGNYVLVVGFNSSVFILPFSYGKGNWVRNCIYFTDNNVPSQCKHIAGGHDVGVFNLEDGRVHKLFPNSEFLHPPPVWLCSQNFIC